MNTILADMEHELYRIYDNLNKDYYDGKLPDIIITIQGSHKNKYYGWFGEKKWNNGVNFVDMNETENPLIVYHEINISAEHLDRPIEDIVGTMQHEMIHLYCNINQIKDTSNNHVYHNKKFKEEAEKRGLIIEKAKTIGWSVTTPNETFKEYIKKLNVNSDVFKFCRVKEEPKAADSVKKMITYKCPNCGISATAKPDINIMCGNCNIKMIPKEKKE